jgi:HD superfamily phosphohydrolase
MFDLLQMRDSEEQHPLLSQFEAGQPFRKQVAINDFVYGPVSLPAYCWMFVDAPAMQRLKYLHQLGPNYFVFPGATHSRFEHSLGTSYLCDKLMRHLIKAHQPTTRLSQLTEPVFSANEHKCVVLAGLMHDLGHGIFSHLFDRKVIRSIYESQSDEQRASINSLENNLAAWDHEQASQMLIEHTYRNLSEECAAEGLLASDMRLVQDLVTGEHARYVG